MREDAGPETLAAADRIVGTTDYISPEQWQDATKADTRADIYSLGCTLFKLLVGHAPYHDVDELPRAKMKAHLNAPIPSVSELRPTLPAGLDEVVTRMLAKTPSARYPSPIAVATTLEPFTTGSNLRDLVRRAYVPGSDTQSKVVDITVAIRSMVCAMQRRVKRRKALLTLTFLVFLLTSPGSTLYKAKPLFLGVSVAQTWRVYPYTADFHEPVILTSHG